MNLTTEHSKQQERSMGFKTKHEGTHGCLIDCKLASLLLFQSSSIPPHALSQTKIHKSLALGTYSSNTLGEHTSPTRLGAIIRILSMH